MGGTIFCALSGFIAGIELVVMSPGGMRNPAMVNRFWHIRERYGVTLAGAAPTSLGAAPEVPVGDANSSSIRAGFCGAASLPLAVGERLRQARRRLLPVYNHSVLRLAHEYTRIARGGKGMKRIRAGVMVLLAIGLGAPGMAFQIAPMGSRFEQRLTNETESTLARTAGKVGVLLKAPVHEEITHLGFGCPADQITLSQDTTCSGTDVGWATPFVIYGVRWNDLPPFRLSASEGNCSYLGQATCRVDQTIRFSTQPLCWYCLFKDAAVKAQTKRITGCEKGRDTVGGTVMTRSHFGDLQFLHGMASEERTDPSVTRAKILDWLEFAWKVSSKEIGAQTFLRDIDIPTIQFHFGCTEWRVSDLYILGRQDTKSGLLNALHHIAFGSVLHTVQDSFAVAHTSRESTSSGMCLGADFEAPPKAVEFHTYGAQDGTLHDEQDSRIALASNRSPDRWPLAVDATRNLVSLREAGAKWADAKTYMACLFELSEKANVSSPGELFKRVK